MSIQRIYIIGTGHIAGSHARAALELGEAIELHATDLDADRLAAFQAQFPEVVGHASAEAMLAEPPQPTDVVIVATPPRAHVDPALQALEAGRHVLCEKPLAMSADEAQRMLAAARRAGKRLGCCSNRFVGSPAVERLRRDVARGAFGSLYRVLWVDRRRRNRVGIDYLPQTMAWAVTKKANGGGVLMDWGPYDFTTLHRVLQPIALTVLSAWAVRPEAAMTQPLPEGVEVDVEFHVGAQLLYELADGSSVQVDFERSACLHGPERRQAEFEGTAATAELDWLGFQGPPTLHRNFDEAGEPARERLTGEASQTAPMARPLTCFLQAVRGEPSSAVIDEQALFNFACLRAIYDAAASKRPIHVRLDPVAV